MTPRDEQRQHVIEALGDHLLRTGLSQSSLRQLAGAAGVSDRMLLYYFDDKAEVLAQVLTRLAASMSEQLNVAIPEGERLSPAALTARAARIVIAPAFLPYMRLWLEVVAAAGRNEAPFAQISQAVAHGFLEWIEQRLQPIDGRCAAGQAAAILALVDGLVLVEISAGSEPARQAVGILEAFAGGQAPFNPNP